MSIFSTKLLTKLTCIEFNYTCHNLAFANIIKSKSLFKRIVISFVYFLLHTLH